MEIYRNINNRMNQARFRNSSFRKAALPQLKALTTQVDDSFFHNKNIVISGEFFPMSENLLKENLVKREANLQPGNDSGYRNINLREIPGLDAG